MGSPRTWAFFVVCLTLAALSFATARRFAQSSDVQLRLASGLVVVLAFVLAVAPPPLIVDGTALLGIGGVVLAVGITRSDRSHRATGAAVVGVGIAVIGASAMLFGLDFLGAGGRLFGIAVTIYGIGIIAFAAGILASHEMGRIAANIVIGLGATGIGVAVWVAIEPDQIAEVGQLVLAVGVTVFGIGVIGVSAGLLTHHDRSADWAVLVLGLGGIIAGLGAALFGLEGIGQGNDVDGAASLVAGVAAIAFGISSLMFGGGRLIDHRVINENANIIFGWAGIGGGLGGLLAGAAIAVSRADRALSGADGDALLTTARAVASIGVGAGGIASIALGRRDLARTSESFQVTPDALRRRGVRPPL